MNAMGETAIDEAIPARRLTGLVIAIALMAAAAAAAPFLLRDGTGPERYRSIRGSEVITYGRGPYRHMPADVAVQGLAQDVVTLGIAVPFLLMSLKWARSGARAGHLVLTGAVAYFFVQYFLYLAMATYNELFLLWVALLLLSSQALARLLLAKPAQAFEAATPDAVRRYIGGFLIANGLLIGLLWLSVVVPPLVDGRLYPDGLFHLTTMIVQGFDLALFLPPSLIAGVAYLQRRAPGGLLAPVCSVFLSLQMIALLAKIAWMQAVGVSAGPAVGIIPALLAGAIVAAVLALRPHRAVA
jgi:hypothetical protein